MTPRYNRLVNGQGWAYSLGTGFDASQGNPLSPTLNLGSFIRPALALCGEAVFIFYHGAATANTREQIWSVVQDGETWQAPVTVTDQAVRSANAAPTCAPARVHLAYGRVGQMDANHQIYYTSQERLSRIYLPLVRR